MIKFLTSLYDRLEAKRWLMWLLIAVSTVFMAFFAAKIDYSEDITDFLPDAGGEAFTKLKMTDRIVFMISGSDDPYELCDAADMLSEQLYPLIDNGLLAELTEGVDASQIEDAAGFIYSRLPLYLDDGDYLRMDSLVTPQAVEDAVKRSRELLASPAGMAVGSIVLTDPLAIATDKLQDFSKFGGDSEYGMVNGRIFSPDESTLLMFADPGNGMGDTGDNAHLTEAIEKACREVSDSCGVKAEYFGAACVAAHNAAVIKSDTLKTIAIALVAIALLIGFSFRRKRTIPLILIPVAYGALFALCLIYFISGSISAIAIGAGAAVMGVALSYSIHMVAHSAHCADPKRLIVEMAYPLTLGSFTTIAAFAALIFTRSRLLHDFGLFTSLTLVGTTLFCLFFLPHFLKGGDGAQERRARRFIDKVLDYPVDRNKWVVGGMLLLILVCSFFCGKVRFDADMGRLNYMTPELRAAEAKLEAISGGAGEATYIISSAGSIEDAVSAYAGLRAAMDTLCSSGAVDAFASAGEYIIPLAVQQERIAKWNEWWNGSSEGTQDISRRDALKAELRRDALAEGFRENAFAAFERIIDSEYEPSEWTAEDFENMPVLRDWVSISDDKSLIVSRINIEDSDKETVYAALSEIPDTSVADRGYWASRMAADVNDDFNFILWISSLIVFFALWVSYGRLELAVLAFLPMLAGWVIILGMMAMLGIKFNIVSIILATFIFGIGDDFSIFIMDGLMAGYRDGSKLLASHKNAIFYSAMTMLIGIGVLVIARHPAMQSIGLIAVLGIAVVLLVEFTVQPVLFRLLVTRPTSRKHLYPADPLCILHSIWIWVLLIAGFIVTDLLALLLLVTPYPKKRKKAFYRHWCYLFCKYYTYMVPLVRFKRIEPDGSISFRGPSTERFKKPAMLIANHQSLLDVVMMIGTTPKMVMITKGYVFRNPLLGPIVRYAGYFNTEDGYESMRGPLAERIAEGCSVVVFPEATRSYDGDIIRFHKGAFAIAEEFRLDIIPVLFYGTGYICPKGQDYQCRPSLCVRKVYERRPYDAFGPDLRTRAKGWKRWFTEEYEKINAIYNHPSANSYAVRAMMSNYLYKGADIWRAIKSEGRRTGWWDRLERAVPRDAGTVVFDCGYGAPVITLGMLAHGRSVLGVDSDSCRIAVAKNCYMAQGRYGGAASNMHFECCEASQWGFRPADAFVLSDRLAADSAFVEKCRANLSPGGLVVKTDGSIIACGAGKDAMDSAAAGATGSAAENMPCSKAEIPGGKETENIENQ